MQNKKYAIIIVSVAIVLFAATAFIFLYEPAKDNITELTTNEKNQELGIDGELPVLVCKYENDEDSFKDAVIEKNINSCDCVNDEKLKGICKETAMNVSFYDRALAQLDETLCEKISDEIQKDACYQVVQSSVDQFEKEDPQYLADMYAVTHNEKAIEQYESIIASGNNSVDNYISLALSYAEKGLKEQELGGNQSVYVEKAFKAVENAKEIDDKNSEVYRVEAYVNEIKPDYVMATQLYDKALELDSNNVLAHAGKGHVLRIIGALEESVAEFNKAAELDKDKGDVFIYANLCSLEYSREHNEDAIKNCKIVMSLPQSDPVSQSNAVQIMALIFLDENDKEQSRNYLLEAKTLTPNDPNLYVSFADLNLFEQNFKESEMNSRKVITLSPTKAAGYLALSNALYMQDKYNDAIEVAEEGIILVADDVSLLTAGKAVMERNLNYAISNNYRALENTQKQQEYENRGNEAFEDTNSLEVIE
ncbi:MAG: tetratricopeptide repeat protein [Candidatus Moraniibacteriota bacterium]|jgi:tetratricopeptide (TPR) repeat protein